MPVLSIFQDPNPTILNRKAPAITHRLFTLFRGWPIFLFAFVSLTLPQITVFAKGSVHSFIYYQRSYKFTVDTFTDRICYWESFLSEYKGKPGIHYLEIGVYEGRSLFWMLDNILTDPTSQATVIDTFDGPYYRRFLYNLAISGAGDRVRILRGLSTDEIHEVPVDSVDIAYIDGSGRSDVMFEDLVNAWDRVRQGGLIICNRYRMTHHLARVLDAKPGDGGPIAAIQQFLNQYKDRLLMVMFQPNFVVVRKAMEPEVKKRELSVAEEKGWMRAQRVY
ncbi:class I SAM-dependent methyltransferase [Candidatus Methylacidithermus pantelleriae]|nr:class I SAM-dependent methyltransferase [Candidatus Methylacidithermus pantelleriae]